MVGVIITALLLWVGSTLLDVRERLVRIESIQQTATATSTTNGNSIHELEVRIRLLEMAVQKMKP